MRNTIHEKFDGRCAYCGKDITLKQMQVDHIVPLFRNDTNEALERMGIIRGTNTIDNLNPACARCNRYKSTMTIENFRKQISLQVERLEKRSWNYRMAKDFNLITETNNDVKFYFETI